MNTPEVSILCLTYNHEKYISQCLDSFLMQETNFDYEIILGEDESKDGTREICQRYAEKHPDKIRLFLRSRKDVIYINGQATGRYNLVESLKACRGKYIALCEGDDYWTDPLKLRKQVDLLEQNLNLIACHHWQKLAINTDGVYKEVEAPRKGHGYYPESISTVRNIFANELRLKSRTILFRNVIQSDFFPNWFFKVAYGDVPLTMLLGRYGSFAFINEEMAVYRVTDTGVSRSGLSKIGIEMHRVERMKNWIIIWDYGNQTYHGKYYKEYSQTVREFYKRILQKKPFTLRDFRSILYFTIMERPIGSLKKMEAIFSMVPKMTYTLLKNSFFGG